MGLDWRFVQALVVATLCLYCDGQEKGKQEKIVNVGGNGTDARLGLLASTLGIAPVPGYGSENAPPSNIPNQEYLPTGGAPEPSAPYTASGGIHGGNGGSGGSQCQCVPTEYCPSYSGNAGGDSYGSPGQQGGNLPVIGGGGGSYGEGQQGGIIPVVGGGGGSYGSVGQQGGNIPVIGGGGGSYGEGQQGGNIPVSGGGPGYGEGSPEGKPNTDGSGLLDLRIVNRPPHSGGVQCLNGQVFCCDVQKPNSGSNQNYPGPGGSGGYVTCGSRDFIDVPGRKLEYGDAKFGAYPWMSVILGKGNNYVGAGALISPYYVLTAAHKIKSWKRGAAMKVRFGEWNAKEDDEPYKNIEVDIENVIIHPGFNLDNLQNDIALIKLAQPIDTNKYPHIKAACLPEKGYQYTGQRCWVSGFGKDAFGNGKHSYIMKEVDLPIVDSNICEQRLRTTRLGKYFELNRYSFLCAGGEEGKDACSGDGGAPLVCDTGKGWQVVGLVAWGIGCADYGIPGAYVNVPNYLDWINEIIYY